MRLFIAIFLIGAYDAVASKYGLQTDFGYPTGLIMFTTIILIIQDINELFKK